MKPIERVEPVVTEQPWGMETLLAETPWYSLKRLDYRAGQRGGLQMHLTKTESFTLVSGEAEVLSHFGVSMDADRQLVLDVARMQPGQTFTIPAGAPHQFIAITDCVVFEASQPVHNDRVNVADRYGLEPEPDALPTTWTAEQIERFEETGSPVEGQRGMVTFVAHDPYTDEIRIIAKVDVP